jgi:hypothetical protein
VPTTFVENQFRLSPRYGSFEVRGDFHWIFEAGEGERFLAHFLQAGGDCRAFQPSFADEGFALRLDLLLRVGVDHPRRFPHAPVIADDLQFF